MDRLTQARRARDAGIASTPIAALENELRSGFDLEFRLQADLARARHRRTLRKQEQDACGPHASIEKKGARAGVPTRSRRDEMEAAVRAAQTAYEDATTRLNNALNSPQIRAQRLRVIDPGTVPHQPASPSLWLNTAAAFWASLIGAFGFLILRFGYVRLQREKSERVYSLV